METAPRSGRQLKDGRHLHYFSPCCRSIGSLRLGQELEIVSFSEGGRFIIAIPFHKICFPTIVRRGSACFRHLYFRTSVCGGGLISHEG